VGEDAKAEIPEGGETRVDALKAAAAPRAFIGLLFSAASFACVSTLLLNAAFTTSPPPLSSLSFPSRVFWTVLTIFFLPAVVLGMISPVTAKMALERSKTLGRTIGSVYAWGAVGSIVGTLATGFWLIALLGVRGVVLLISLTLACLGIWLGPKRVVQSAWALLLAGLIVVSVLPSARAAGFSAKLGLIDKPDKRYIFARDGHYQYVRVYRGSEFGGKGRDLRTLILDHLVHGYVDPKDPSYLHYRYEKLYRDVLAAYHPPSRKPLRAFFIGGGSYTFPRWLEQAYPGARIDVAEIDPLVLEANHQALGLSRKTRIYTILMDARNAVADMPKDRRYDAIFGDAFNDLSIPFHLVTREFAGELASHLTPRGIYLLNVIDEFASGKMLCALHATLRRVFKHVYVFSTSKDGVSAGRETFVVAASRHPLDVRRWYPGHSLSFSGCTLPPPELERLTKRCNGLVLRDGYAPVENLLSDVMRRR
jgi:spermidine synthase